MLHRFFYNRKHIFVEVEIERVLEPEPARVVEATLLLELHLAEGRFGQKVSHVLALFTGSGVAGDVLILPQLFFDCNVKAELFFYRADGPLIGRLFCYLGCVAYFAL